jgi:glycosyltransferase involved in cell wall biosynthesis
MISAVYRGIFRLPRDHPLRRSGRFLRRSLWVRHITDRMLRLMQRPVDYAAEGRAYFDELLDCAAEIGAKVAPTVPRRVLLVNNGLAPGGAERQIVNTLLGLRDQPLESIGFLGEYLGDTPERRFLLPELERAGIRAEPLQREWRFGMLRGERRLAQLLARLPIETEAEILDLVAAFHERRPEVVHAWQDETAIKCAIAGLIAGVPRIVLSTRNVNPSNFDHYHQPYMRPAYQALAERPQIILSNNSEAGAADYCAWLGLDRGRFRVVRNGIAFDELRRDPEGARALREREGIPPDAPVVGTMIRFSAEKRPMLWLDTALRLSQERPRCHFLLIGSGPLEAEMRRFIAGLPSRGAFHLLPPTAAVAAAYSAMNVFLLTSRFEGTPNVVLEAQWLGLPVVAFDAGGVRESIAAGESGFVCGGSSPQPAVAQLCRIIDEPEWTERAGAAGPRFVRERFRPERMIAETMALYGFGDG